MRASTSLPAMVVVGLLVGACSPAPVASPTPAMTAAVETAPAATGGPGAGSGGGTPGPSLASQTDTAWGRIWDALPPSFPAMAGTKITTDTGAGASSAQLSVPAARD